MNTIDKKVIIYVLIAVVISGLAGFYGGRYYERTAVRKKFVQMRANGGNFQGRQGGFRGQGLQPQGQNTQPAPVQQAQPVPTK